MAETAKFRLYKIRDDFDIDTVARKLPRGFVSFNLDFTHENMRIFSFKEENRNDPDWLKMIRPKLGGDQVNAVNPFKTLRRYSLVMLIEYRHAEGNEEAVYNFAITGWSGNIKIAEFLDDTFGIQVAERIFDETNLLTLTRTKSMVGDVLADMKLFRTARPAAYEDNFGKYFQQVVSSITKEQIETHFPSIFNAKDKWRFDSGIAFEGASCLELSSKVNFDTFMDCIEDVVKVLRREPNDVFSQSLKPIATRFYKEKVAELEEVLFSRLYDFMRNHADADGVHFDFCHVDVENFMKSSAWEITLNGIKDGNRQSLKCEDTNIVSLLDGVFLRDRLAPLIRGSREYADCVGVGKRKLFIDTLRKLSIITKDEEGDKTRGGLLHYIQAEMKFNNAVYFHIDRKWYQLEANIDEILAKDYSEIVVNKIASHDFIEAWEDGWDEHAYNDGYFGKENFYVMHPILVKHLELADILYFSAADNVQRGATYIIHVKDSLGATVRDLVSQVKISAQIIEAECKGREQPFLRAWYDTACAAQGRGLDRNALSLQEFIDRFRHNKRVYCLAVRDTADGNNRLSTGEFGSRIAKHSFIELCHSFRAHNSDFCIVDIPRQP